MHNGDKKRTVKTLIFDMLMGLNFVFLLIVALWIVWVYYFRGPIEIVTGESKDTDQELLIQARSEYTTHFHNLDLVVLKGIQTNPLCAEGCHGDYPHSKGRKVRSLFNAHAWFMACEVCHLKAEDSVGVVYRWLDNKTGEELTTLVGKDGDYGATIVPVRLNNGSMERLDIPPNADFIKEYTQTRDTLDDDQQKAAVEKIHETMAKEPIYCDKCHVEDSFLDFANLLYPPQTVMHLESIDMGAMAKTYKEFHLPPLFDP
jgi:hypothetical protein